MSEIILWSGVLFVSIFLLVHSSTQFTNAAERIGAQFKIPPFVIGVTIVAIGTSLPELLSSIIAVTQGASEIVIGNVVGSNITNILLIAGLTAIVGKNVVFSRELVNVDLPLFITSAFFLAVMIWDGEFTRPEAVLSLIALFIYVLYTIKSEMQNKDKEIEKEMKGELDRLLERKQQIQDITILVISSVFLYVSAKYTVESVVEISTFTRIPSDIIAATVVALGTSLPEIMVTIIAAQKNQAELALGNVLGSSIFNSYLVMGIPGLISSMLIPASVLSFSLPVMVIASLLFFFFTQDKEITDWEGWMLILFYIFFVGKMFLWF